MHGLRLVVIGAAAALMGLAAPLHADDAVLEQIDAAKRAYASGDKGLAVAGLNAAIAEIRRQQTEAQMALFPQPLPGWSATDPKLEAAGLATAFVGKMMSRRYWNAATGAEVVITVSADSPFLGFVNGLMQMPLLMQGEDGSGAYVHEGRRGILERQAEGAASLTLVLDNDVLLQIEGNNGADRAAVEDYLAAIDLDAMQRAFDD